MKDDENIVPKTSKSKPYKKVRLKSSPILNNRHFIFSILVICISFSVDYVVCNRPPKFVIEGQSEIVLRLREGPETPVGSLIYKLKGYDPDGDQLAFGVRHSADSEIFRIENMPNNEANIYLNKELDRETKDEYYIILTLTDNLLGEGNFVTQSLLLLVEDINDNEPIFKPYKSALEVPENSGPGIITTVEATDRDEGAYGQVVYYLQELEGDNDVFSIGTQHGKGVIRLVKDLDYERKSLYQLRVLAIDRANQGPINTGTADILVKVKDIEDQPPVFSTVTPVTRISEDAPIGSSVVQLKAHDGDRGINNQIKYSIIRGGNGLFAINENSGLIYSEQSLDREDPKNQENGAYILQVTATEQNSKLKPAPSVTTEITIILTDVNDETPSFRSKFYEAEISENAQENTPLTFIGDTKNDVFDYDQGNNGTFELIIEPQNQIFDISPKRAINEATFLIRLKNNNALDFENIFEMNYTLIAREVVANGKWSSASLRIYIRDSNDNFPEFVESIYNFSVLENSPVGTVIGAIRATDKDSGNFGAEGIRYTSLGGSIAQLLNLNAITGVISIQSLGEFEFDRETIAAHYLTAEARDDLGHGNRNTVQIVLNIKDINDNAPMFLEKQYEAKLFENSMNFDLPLVVKAKDADLKETRNSDITYSIIEGEYKNNFTIHKKLGFIKPIKPLDFEALQLKENAASIQPVNLTIMAKDAGVPSLSAKVSVIIYLHDVNDHAPEFQRKYYEIAIPENVPGGSFVLQVTSLDRDGSSPNNVIAYRIQNGASDKFVISSDTGAISVASGASLDPDLTAPKTTEYSLSVLALDGGLGDQQLMSSTIVNISILDVNNKPPSFVEPGKITLNENTAVGTSVYKLLAHDLDANPVLRFYLDASNSEARTEEGILIRPTEYDFTSAFQINPEDGSIKVMKLIDRERVEQIKLGVTVEDVASETGKQIDSAFMTIIIEDVNDNNPKFRKPYYKRSITENSPNGIAILNVAAYDIDKNRTIHYALEGPVDIVGLIQIDSETGEIVVANKIDHEVFQWLNCTVRATDSGVPQRSSLVDVFIRIIDENDNNPYFIGESSNLTVMENSPIGTRISMIQAKDADSGDFGKITYLIDKMSSLGKFLIDADTGVLMVADDIDREEKSSYMIVVEAWDNYQFGYLSGESRNAFKQFFVQITDENDSPPVLHVPKNVIQISEYHDVGEVVAHIKATDADDPTTLNGQIELSITGGNGKDFFKLVQKDRYSADINAKRSLQNYYGNYTVQLTATDLGTPPNSAVNDVYIFILDFNDHAPVFTSPINNITIRVPENETIGTEIVKVSATDNDVGANAAVLYRLKQDSMGSYRSFTIDQKSGIITLKKSLDRERQKIYEIRVEAYDQGIPPLSSDLDINIYVRNVNDYEPQFIVDEIVVNFTEHKTPGTEKIKLPDTVDRDEVDDLDDPPSVVCYFIVYGNSDNIFHLEPESHVLTIRKELDREVKSNHTLIVKASEDCSKTPINITLPVVPDMERMSYHSALTRTHTSQKFDWFNRYKHSRSLRDIRGNNSEITKQDDEEPYFQSLLSGALNEDGTLVQVIVYVDDINDNAPAFVSNVFTGGVTTAADFGTTIMNVLALDKDYGFNAQVNYYRIGDIHQTLTEGLEKLSKPPFLVDSENGAVILNFDPQKGMKGYFDFMVLANDTDGLQDIAHVFIYLLREDQRVRFVLRQQPPQIRDRLDMFRETLSNVTDAIVNVDDFKIHENRDGSVDKTKTDLYLHLVNKLDNSIVEVPDVLRLIDQNVEKLDNLFKEFNVLDTQPSEITIWNGGITQGHTILWLILTNLFITTLLVVVLSLCFSQRKTFKRQLRAARVIAYGTSDFNHRGATTKVPNTNKHSSEGSNPMWLKAYANEWYRNEEDLDPPPAQVNNNGPDSLDENVLANDSYIGTPQVKEFNGFITQNNLSPLNVYHQIEKLTNNAQMLTRKLETTEL